MYIDGEKALVLSLELASQSDSLSAKPQRPGRAVSVSLLLGSRNKDRVVKSLLDSGGRVQKTAGKKNSLRSTESEVIPD